MNAQTLESEAPTQLLGDTHDRSGEVALADRELDTRIIPRSASARERGGAFPTVSVVIPTLNEALNLPVVLGELPDVVDEVVIVDGLSTDDTVDVALRLRPDATIVMQTGRGKGDALRCGFEAATGDILVMMDADGSTDPAEIPRYLDALLAGADFAKGTRFTGAGGSSDLTRVRTTGNRMLSGTVNLLYGTGYTDLCYGYNAFWRHCLPTMSIDCSGFEIETLINIRVGRAGLDVREIPSFERDRIHGQSNLRAFRDGGRILRTILRERVRKAPTPPVHRSGHDTQLSGELGFAGETV